MLSPDVLLEHRADPTLEDEAGETASEWAEGSSARGHTPPGSGALAPNDHPELAETLGRAEEEWVAASDAHTMFLEEHVGSDNSEAVYSILGSGRRLDFSDLFKQVRRYINS